MSIKLSDKQKEVIQKLRGGAQLTKVRNIGYTAVTIGPQDFVNLLTFYSLVKKGLIDFSSKEHGISYYKLTELSKKIEL